MKAFLFLTKIVDLCKRLRYNCNVKSFVDEGEKRMNQRTSGVLMHITSLPGTQGVGTFGKEAYEFVDFLVETDQTYWQILPLTTTSYGDSPYQSFSATAGNTHLIDLEQLADQGFLDRAAFEGVNFGDDVESVDYARIFDLRRPILEQAVKGF